MPARRAFLLAIASGALPASALGATQPALQRRRTVFGSPAALLLARRADAAAGAAADAVFVGLQRMNDRWNAWKPGELSSANAALRAGRPATVSPALAAMIRGAAALESASQGLFNPAIGRAVGGWGFHDDRLLPGARPSAAAIRRWQAQRPSLAQLDLRGTELRSRNPRVQLDFGAYAKGVAADWALAQLSAAGVADALVDLGGNVAAMGQGAEAPWRVGIRDPFGDGLVASLHLRGREAVVTSGSYERWRLLDGERCCHIIDPASAVPAAGFVSVTVVHASAALADAAATAIFVAGPKRWRQAAQQLGVAQVLVIDAEGAARVTPALAGRMQFADAHWRRAVTPA